MTQFEILIIFKETGKCFADGDCKAKREAESTNKVEPKFKVGDWIINKYMHLVMQILNNDNGSYKTVETDGTERNDSYDFIERNFKLWTIQDAKDGDVLCVKYGNDEMPFIFTGKQHDVAYCALNSFGEFVLSMAEWLLKVSVLPATKEQRDTLFAKMKEAGYIWIFSKKELIKVEQNPTKWSEEDERNIQTIDSVLFYDRKLPEDTCVKLRDFLKILKERVGCEANCTTTKKWSEEDEKRLNSCLSILRPKTLFGNTEITNIETINTKWLKSIKQRIGG